MKSIGSFVAVLLALFALGGCAGGAGPTAVPSGPAAYAAIPVTAETEIQAQVLRPGDRLAIRVFGEPELTSEQYRIDAAGYLQFPLVGELIAATLKPAELRDELVRRLGGRYLRDPQITVSLAERAKRAFAVEGQVREPGVYDASSTTTLLVALAQAKSPTNVAKLDEVLVFRNVNGERLGARFDVNAIRAGRAADPQILAGDVVVVGFSALKGVYRDILQAAPLVNLFNVFTRF